MAHNYKCHLDPHSPEVKYLTLDFHFVGLFSVQFTVNLSQIWITVENSWLNKFTTATWPGICACICQCRMMLQCNTVDHWLGAYTEWSLFGPFNADPMWCTLHMNLFITYMDHFWNAPSQWETRLHYDVVSYWLGAFTKWSLHLACRAPFY